MTGSEKQIKWAEDIIRNMRTICADDLKGEIVKQIRNSADPAAAKASLKLTAPISNETLMAEAAKAEDALVAAHDNAAWWIDNRYDLKAMVTATFFSC